MEHECNQNENISKLFNFNDEKIKQLQAIEIRQVRIESIVEHVKGRLDNGMSHTISDIHKNLVELKPIIEHHADIVRRIEDFGWLISRWLGTGLVMCLLGMIVWAVSKGFQIK